MSFSIAQLSESERSSLQQVREAIRRKQTDVLITIRNDIILNSDKQLSLVEAFDDILRANGLFELGNGDNRWNCLRKTAETYDTNQAGTGGRNTREWRTRVRQTLFISMQWSLETLTRYGWDTEKFKRDPLTWMYNCAMTWPNFEDDFIPQVNLVRWLKHCSALAVLDKAKPNDFAPEGEEFAVKDLHSLSDLRRGEPVSIYGREVTLETAGQLKDEIRRWCENRDGVVSVGGRWLDLKEHRPTRWNVYLLKFNENGLLVRRGEDDEVPTPRRSGILSPPPSMRQTASLKAVPMTVEASDMESNESGSVAGGVVIDSDGDNTASSVVDVAVSSTTCSATATARHNTDLHNVRSTRRAMRTSAERTSSHGSAAPAFSVNPEPSENESTPRASCVRRSARINRTAVAQPGDNDGGCDEDHGDDKRPSNELPDKEPAREDPESKSRVDDSSGRTPSSISSIREKHDERRENTHDPTRERSTFPHETPMKSEEVAQSRGAEALVNVLSERADESYASGAGTTTTPDLRQVESWLNSQEGSTLFVENSPTDTSHRELEGPEATPSVQLKLSKENDKVSNDGASPIRDFWSSANDRDKVASSNPSITTSLPPATRKSPETSPAHEDSPRLVDGQAMEAELSTPDEKTSSDTMSESASEPRARRNMDNIDAAKTPRCLTPTSTEPSSRQDDSSPSETSSNSGAGEAWPGCNARDMSSPLKFAGMNQYSYTNLSVASDPMIKYLNLMPPSVSMPYIIHESTEGDEATKHWATAYASLNAGPRAHSAGDFECSNYSDGTSRDSSNPPPTHFGPRPGDCACDVCDDIVPLLERIRSEASSNGASRICRARARWFGSAKWASAVEVFDLGQAGKQPDHEVIYADHSSFREMMEEGLALDRPIVITGYRHGHGVYGVEALQKALKDSYGNLKVTMTNAHAGMSALVGMEEFLKRFSDDEWAIGSSTPRGSFGTQPPDFLSYDRYRLLQSAVTRASCHPLESSNVDAGCDIVAHSLFVNGGLSFNRIESSGAFSGPCLGSLGGTWLHVLKGRRLCAFVPRERFSTSFRDAFVGNGLEWEPQNEQRLVLLEPDDVLVLPADVVCAQLAVSAGVSFEGSFWDERDWGRYFAAAAAQWEAVRPDHAGAETPQCAIRMALHGLRSIAKDDPRRFASDPLAQDFLETDRSGVFEKISMAGRCSPGWTAEVSGLQDESVLGTSDKRRKSGAQGGDEQGNDEPPGKRMCIRPAISGAS